MLRVLPGGDLQWEYKYYHETTTHPTTPGQWHWVVVKAQSPTGAQQIFVDGVAAPFNQRTETGAVSTVSTPLTIGYAGYGSEYFDGATDDVRVYNRALNPTDCDSQSGEAVANSRDIAFQNETPEASRLTSGVGIGAPFASSAGCPAAERAEPVLGAPPNYLRAFGSALVPA